jgi:hypothetical protein
MVLILALAIGANTAVFSVFHAILLRPLPYPGADRIVTIENPPLAFSATTGGFRLSRSLRENPLLEAAAMYYASDGANLSDQAGAERVSLAQVSGEFFRVLGRPALVGRALLPEDEATGASDIAVISEGLWRRRFASAPGIVGTSVRLSGHAFTIGGVMADDVSFPDRTDVWAVLPLIWDF